MVDDPIRAFLVERGVAPQVIEGGLEFLVRGWERTVHEVEDGYGYGIEDWLNDLDGRQLLHEIRPHASDERWAEYAARIAAADERFRAATVECERCLWGAEAARTSGYTAATNWWYWRDVPDVGEDREPT